MTIRVDYGQVKVEFDIDGTEQSTLDWEMPSWNVRWWYNDD